MPRTAWIVPAMALQDRLDRERFPVRLEVRPRRLATVGRAYVVEDDLLEFLGDSLALERHRLLAVDVHRCDGNLAGAWQTDADIGHLRLAGAVDDAAHY